MKHRKRDGQRVREIPAVQVFGSHVCFYGSCVKKVAFEGLKAETGNLW